MRFFRPIMDFSEKYNILQSAMAASERIFKLLDTPVDIISPAVTKKPAGPGRIEFDHVWFAYREMAEETDSARTGKNHVGIAAVAVRPSHSAATSGNGDAGSQQPDWVLRDVSFLDRTRRDRGGRRPHRRRQDDADFLAAAFLRCAERRGAHRRHRCQRNGPRRPAQPLRRRAARSVPLHRHDRRQHPPGHRAHPGRTRAPRPPKM